MIHHSIALLLWTLFLLIPGVAWGAEAGEDTLKIVSGDRPAIRVVLESGQTFLVTSVRVRSSGTLHFTREGAPDSVLAAKHVRAITDEHGGNRTRQVLIEEKALKVGDPNPQLERVVPTEVRGWMVGLRVGELLPIRTFRGDAANGLGVDASIEIRNRRHSVWGLALEYDTWGGDEERERDLAAVSLGEVDKIRFTSWGPSVSYRYLAGLDPRVNPYFQWRLGPRRFTTSIEGAYVEGHKTVWALAQELSLGVNVRLNRAYRLDLHVAHPAVSIHRGTAHAGSTYVQTSGGFECLRFGVGLIRTFPR